MPKNIFFIGPASVGKSTAAKLLAEKLGRTFVDIDKEFCERIALIGDYLNANGYEAYCEANSALVGQLLLENPENTVFATPAGFLAHEKSPHLVAKHLKLIKQGVSVLLLPDKDPQKGIDVIVARQLARWHDVEEQDQRFKFLDRFEKYKNYGDIQIFSMESAEVIVELILKELNTNYGSTT